MNNSQSLYKFMKYINTDFNGIIDIDYMDWLKSLDCKGRFCIGIGKTSGMLKGKRAVLHALDEVNFACSGKATASSIAYLVIYPSKEAIVMEEITEIGEHVANSNLCSAKCNVIFGVYFDNQIDDDIQIVVFASGIE